MKKNGYLASILVLFFLLPPVYAREKTFTVIIDAGHGGKDPGAIGSLGNEKEINLAVALKLGALISANHDDVNVIYTRKTDIFVDLFERADLANRNKADLFISIHANAVERRSNVKGAETYTLGLARSEENLEVAKRENAVILLEDNYLQKYGGFDPNSTESYIIFEFMQNKYMEQSVDFASEIQKYFASSRRVDRGVRQAGFLVLRETSMPSVLVELGFITNKEEEQYIRSAAGQNQLAQSIYSAFKSYYRQQGVMASRVYVAPANATLTLASATMPAEEIVYKVQILSSDRQLPADSPFLKGYNAGWYKDGNLYKYTYGESADLKTIQAIQKELSKDFKDAFVIRMKDGQRLK